MKVKTDSILSRLGNLNDEEFKVLFFILNSINMNSKDKTEPYRVKIYRAVLADLCGKSERTITRITNKLMEKGLIIKDYEQDKKKTYNYYSVSTEDKKVVKEKKTIEKPVVKDENEFIGEIRPIKDAKEILKLAMIKDN